VSALVTELELNQFCQARPIFSGMGMHLAVESILAGETAARIFIDDAETPKAALTWAGNRVYIAGNVVGAGFGEVLGKYVSTRGQFVAYCGTGALDGAEELLSGYHVGRRGRFYYEENPSRVNEVEPPEGYRVERISEELLGLHLEHTDEVKEEMCSERSSIEEFFEKSFGFAAYHSREFASWCMSEYNLGNRCDVGIETVNEHQRKGLAVLVASVMFKYAEGVGIRRVGWHCWADNEASIATAEKLGLKRIVEYTVLAVDARPTL
jgi:hypothetical protein